MERLILFRHGKAEPDSESGEDFDRRLAPRGVRESAAMGQSLADIGVKPAVALVSTSARTRETWQAAADNFPGAKVNYLPALYHADAGSIRAVAREAGLGKTTLMIVGHNPGLQELTLNLLAEGGAPASLLARAGRSFPPSAAAVFLIDDNGKPQFDGLFYPERKD